jgi:hypothetical protein
MRTRFGVVMLLAAACSPEPVVSPVELFVHAPAELPAGAALAADDLTRLVGEMAAERFSITRDETIGAACVPGEIHIEVLGHALGEPSGADTVGEQEVWIDDTGCDDGRLLKLRGGSLLAGQWVVYDLLRDLGVRFFHPEQTFVPSALAFPDRDLSRLEGPDFFRRTIGVHRTHPVELSPPLGIDSPEDADAAGLDMVGYQTRWIDWNVAIKSTRVNAWDGFLVGDYAYVRGFPRGAGFNLLNSQQGGRPILDPDDPRPESEQLAEAIEARLAPVEGLPDVDTFGFQFNPSEFTEEPDEITVERLTFIADYMAENHPEVMLTTINHGTHGAPTENYGVRFFDLSRFAPENLGVKVHTLMFYDLEREAPVYGNADFSELRAFIEDEAPRRRIIHFPEGSWWLTFDLPVPLFLAPVTLEARQRDIELLKPLLSSSSSSPSGVYGHQVFSSGQEWGYWMIDWCASRQTWDTAFTWEDCVDDFAATLPAGDVLAAVFKDVTAHQVTELRDRELLRFLVGSDDETEVALRAGIDFHPLPPQPAEALAFDDERADNLAATLERVAAMTARYATWADALDQVVAQQPPATAPWAREVRDGVRVFALRAAHAVAVYETVLALRAAIAAGDLDAVATASDGVERARAITEAARDVIHARADDYRYPPALSTAGDEPGAANAIENRSIYPYRVNGRAHRLFYWERPDAQLAALFGEGLELVQPSGRVVELGTDLDVALLLEGVTELTVDWGDGETETELRPHRYDAQGRYSWVLDAQGATGVVHHEDEVAVVEERMYFAKGSFDVEYPRGASAIEGLLPGFELGFANFGGEELIVLGRVDGEAPISTNGTLQTRPRVGNHDFIIELLDVGVVRLYDAEFRFEGENLTVQGELETQEIVDLLVSVGGFEPEGARVLIAGLLDYTPETLPARDVLLLTATAR